jgi:ABC-type branched-subunit amino acid transport system permease subunit
MKILKMLNEPPYLLFVTGLCFIGVSFVAILAVGSHTAIWWVLIVIPLIAAVSGFTIGFLDLRRRGLNYSATMGELTEAIDRRSD